MQRPCGALRGRCQRPFCPATLPLRGMAAEARPSGMAVVPGSSAGRLHTRNRREARHLTDRRRLLCTAVGTAMPDLVSTVACSDQSGCQAGDHKHAACMQISSEEAFNEALGAAEGELL